MPTITDQKTELARIMGLETSTIQTLNARWLSLMKEGVIVRLHIRRWRAKTKLDCADLGLPREADDLIDDLLTLGDKRLLPRDLANELEACESSGRKALERAGIPTYWGAFIPATAYDAWRTANDEHKQRYYQLRNRIQGEYSFIVADLLDEYRKAARLAYRRANQLEIGRATIAQVMDEVQFVEAFVRKIRALIPTAPEIYDSFAWEEELSYIPLPSLLAEDIAEAERTRERRRIEAQEEELKRDDLWKEIAIKDEADRARRQMLDRMNEEVVAQARAKKQQLIDGFLQDLIVQLRGMIYDATTDILATMQRNPGKLHPRSVVQLRNMIDQVGKLNFFGDGETTQMINQVRNVFDQRPELRNVEDLKTALTDVAIVVRQSLIDLGQEPRAARIIGDPTITDTENLQRARRRLDLPDNAAPIAVDLPIRPARAQLLEVKEQAGDYEPSTFNLEPATNPEAAT